MMLPSIRLPGWRISAAARTIALSISAPLTTASGPMAEYGPMNASSYIASGTGAGLSSSKSSRLAASKPSVDSL